MENYGTAGQATDDNIIRLMSFACWTTKFTDTYPEYVMYIAFPQQQWLHLRTSILRVHLHSPSSITFIVRLMHSIMHNLEVKIYVV